MSTELEEIKSKADEAFGNLESLVKDLKEAKANGDGQDRINALSAKAEELGNDVATLKQKQADAEAAEANESRIKAIEDRMTDLAKDVRTPSKAAAVLGEMPTDSIDADLFFVNVAMAQNPRAPLEFRQQAQKALAAMGSFWQGVPDASKATLGTDDATGGYRVPKPVVEQLNRVAEAYNPYRSLLSVRSGIGGSQIEIPHKGLAATRAAVVGRGETKPNVNISFSNYTATFYTLAQIADASNQLLRQSRGNVEADIRQELGEALSKGEGYYVLNGSGTNEPKGLLTSIGTSGTFVTTHSSPSLSTVAGNFASAIAKAAAAVGQRSVTPTGVVMNTSDFWISLTSGDDDAGFYIAPHDGPRGINAVGAFENGQPVMSIWGLPVMVDTNMPSDSLVVGAFKKATLYIGEDFRIDTSSEAGDRWDKNLTGFRGEEEIAFNADPYVAAGFFQRIVNVMA